MSTVIANMSMSLDGFIDDRSGGVATHRFGWLQSGRRSSTMPGDGREFRTSSASTQYLQDTLAGLGASRRRRSPTARTSPSPAPGSHADASSSACST